MKHLLVLFFLLCLATAQGQNNIYATAGIAYTVGAPTFTPGSRGTLVAIDTTTGYWYTSNGRNTASWTRMGSRIEKKTGCAAPAYTPAKYQSTIVINSCATPELYEWNGSAWVCLNCASAGATNLSWSEISSTLYRLNSSTGNDVFVREGSGATASLSGDTLTISASGGGGTVSTDATLTGDGSGGSPLGIAQQSAATSEVMTWTGATWEPSWGLLYTFVTTGATITTAVNEILIGTVSANVTFGLPACDATTDSKHFKFVRNGTDAFSVTIDPNGSQTFYDGTSTKISYGNLSLDCTCHFSGGSGVWFFDNF